MEENTEKKICPFCGQEINKEAKKCRFCNNWLDEEIQCPYCAEKIKASAKKCRFCGEWLDKEHGVAGKNQSPVDLPAESVQKEEKSISINLNNDKLYMIAGISMAAVLLITAVIGFINYVPGCKSASMQAKLKEYITSNYSDISNITLDKSSAHKIKKIEKGYSCAIDADIDDTSTRIEYSYKKVSLSEFDMSSKFVLPNCYDSAVKKILNKLIGDYDSYNIKGSVADVYTNYEVQNDYDKESDTYTCSAEATLTSKPGKAFVLNSWSYDDASRQIKCKIDYRTFFCKNGYATCVGLDDLYSCKYEDD